MSVQLNQESTSQKDQWLIAQGKESNLPMLFRMRQEVPPGIHPKNYPILINIFWNYTDTSNNGLPPDAILNRMVELEEQLDRIEGPEIGFMVLSITGNQRKEWIWYTCDHQLFISRLNSALGGLEPFPIELHVVKDPKWKSYTNLLNQVRK